MKVAPSMAWKTRLANAPRADKDKFKKHLDEMLDFSCLMLATMTSELQKKHEDMDVYEMIQNLKEIYEGQARQESFKPFILNFNMNEINKTLPQLLGMLRTAESDLKKNGSKSILMVHEAKGKGKKEANSKGSGKYKPK
ncbi:hypothetical protein V6N12_042497 [Hibiscus sabdariffa]|uniref:Uncharacterized protein n=1 Tax=Hibiscus sabdariffa TaxID=183260 RepID=A0ABR2EFC0_9ROSI